MTRNFAEAYRQKSVDELLLLQKERESLTEAARQALDAEIENRRPEMLNRVNDQNMDDGQGAIQPLATSTNTGGNWFWNWNLLKCLGSFGLAAILSVLATESILRPPPEVIRLLTAFSLKIAFVLAIIGNAIGTRWLTTKRIVIAAVMFSILLFAWIAWLQTTSHYP